MKNILVTFLCTCVVVFCDEKLIRKPPTCGNGVKALSKGDFYCCVENDLEYCCRKDDPYHCKKPEKTTLNDKGVQTNRADDENQKCVNIGAGNKQTPSKNGETRSDAPKSKEPCTRLTMTRTAMAILRRVPKAPGAIPRVVNLAIAQPEGCEPAEQMAVRLTGVEPNEEYIIMVGESVACGGIRNAAHELARVTLPGRIGAMEVPSHVVSISELKGQTVSLVQKGPGGEHKTFACGAFTRF